MYTLKLGRVRMAQDEHGGVDEIVEEVEIASAYSRQILEDMANRMADVLKFSETDGDSWWWDGRALGNETPALWIEE